MDVLRMTAGVSTCGRRTLGAKTIAKFFGVIIFTSEYKEI